MATVHSRHAAPGKHPQRRWNRGDLAILLGGVLAFLSFTFGAPLLTHTAEDVAGRGSVVAVQPVATGIPSPKPVPIAVTGAAEEQSATASPVPALPEAAEPRRIRYPSAGFDVPVHPLDLDGSAQANRTIVPPATKDGYWLAPFGAPGYGSANTTYIIGHSWEGAEAPFNQLSSAAAVGDRFDVDTATGTISYQVDTVTTYLKAALKESPIWEIVPNRLVLISCYTEDPWGKNVVVMASPTIP